MGARVALVTGASRGIGAAIAQRLAADGLFVVGTATTAAGAEQVSAALGEHGLGVALELRDDATIDAALAHAGAGREAPTVLVNNAGVTRDNLLPRLGEDAWQAVLDTNLGGVYRLTRKLLRPMMRARWGRIVNVSSVVARMGNAGQTNYAAAKAGIEGFTRALAQEVGSRGITVNAVAPGFIETDMTANLGDAARAALAERVALGRLGCPEDVAAVVAFLVSDAAAYVTGETVQVNGGLHMA